MQGFFRLHMACGGVAITVDKRGRIDKEFGCFSGRASVVQNDKQRLINPPLVYSASLALDRIRAIQESVIAPGCSTVWVAPAKQIDLSISRSHGR
jgi:hypothetical protein